MTLEKIFLGKKQSFFVLKLTALQAVFSEDAYKTAMTTAKAYDCAGNLFWLNLKWSSCPRVPISRESVKRLQAKLWNPESRDPPNGFDRPTVVAVPETFALIKGNFKRVSPEEPEHAFLFALRDAIQRGESDDMLL